ncbi:MAG: DUF504 domain-containing protein, partial [Methylocaldum sp.]|nr:DUF504 domain-containing protein [Methylocaldum sp.]
RAWAAARNTRRVFTGLINKERSKRQITAMLPIRDLLNRIRWDEDFARAEFAIGYYDRIEKTIVVTPLKRIDFPGDRPGVFELTDSEGETHTIPLHRIKVVYRNGELIWQRTH